MQYLKADTATAVVVGPFIDDTDGASLETALTVTGMDVELVKHSNTHPLTSTSFAPTASGGSNDCSHIVDGLYSLELQATDVDTEGRLFLSVEVAGALPVWHEFMVVAANVYDSLFAAATTDYLDINVKEISDDSTAADNLETACDNYSATRGLSGSALPAVAADGAGGLPVSDAGGLDLDGMNTSIASIESDATDILADTSTTLDTKLNDIQGTTFSSGTDSLEALRNRGDAAWTTGGGGSIDDILQVTPVIPISIDLADTSTVRIGLMLTNMLDDLPTTVEITPGTVSIHRKAIGGTSWSAVVTDGALTEQAGLVYYDEVFDSGTGYAEGDSIRFTFKSQKITVAANDFEITDTNGVMFQTSIRQTMRGTDSAATATALSTAQTDLTLIVADTNELQTDWEDAGRLDAILDAILLDTGTTIPGTITTIDGIVDNILVDTAALNDTKIPDTISLAAIQGEVDTALATYDAPTSAELVTEINSVQTDIAALENIAAADVLTQVNAALDTAISELGVAAPTATPTLRTGLMLLYMALRNKATQTATDRTISNNAGTTICTSATTDSAGTYTQNEFA